MDASLADDEGMAALLAPYAAAFAEKVGFGRIVISEKRHRLSSQI